MKLTEQVRVLEIIEEHTTIYPTLIIDTTDIILVDTGFPTSFSLLKEAIKKEGMEVEQITKIYLTHQDWDHIGCVNTLLKFNPNIKVFAHRLEKPYIEGMQIPIKVIKLRNEGKMDEYNHDRKIFDKLYCKIDETFDGEEIIGDNVKIRIIHTPGHTVGHCVFYLIDSKSLIAGDALYNVDGTLIGSKDKYTQDITLAKESLKPLLELPMEKIICYHGGIYTTDIKNRLEEIIEEKNTY
ncbi:MAG: MBL fold metallo-hydrolase [Coprobacillaceae bacterium]